MMKYMMKFMTIVLMVGVIGGCAVETVRYRSVPSYTVYPSSTTYYYPSYDPFF